MKQILFLLAMLPMILLTACSSDDETNDYESQLVGKWVEDTNSTQEVLNIELNNNKTGFQWRTNNGEIDKYGKESFVWNATGSEVTIILDKGGSMALKYIIKGEKLHISSGDETIIYLRK